MKPATRIDNMLWLGRLALLLVLLLPEVASAALEQTFDVLKIGTTTYRKVTVTTKSKSYIFLLHSQGMASIKVSDLTPELREQLGYQDPKEAKPKTVWSKQTLAKLDVPQVKQFRSRLSGFLAPAEQIIQRLHLPVLNRNMLFVAAGVFLALYLFHCYCCLLICRKAAGEPSALVWVPILQLFPLFKAAGMSPGWFLLPGVAQMVWCVKISQARGKTFWVALLLIFPLTSPLAALYLAFSGGQTARKDPKRVEMMTLEAA